ncbi:DUF3558 family protein [Saccharothrix texasensis]|uniref:DUF3558 family protein n=1 Tax=Saccharothrix texasensis TaxID=103734 RepID=UPI00147755D2|nr:DUF3558 family protein [Saccharothrix texasensis]
MIRPVLVLAVAALALAGCSTKEPGDATAGPTTGGATTTKGSSPTTTSASGASIADFDPCAELEALAAQFNLTAIEDEGADGCFARYSPTVGVTVAGSPDLSIDDAGKGPNAQTTDTTVNGRKAKLVRRAASDTACAVAMEVGSDRVDVVASANASLDEACAAATAVAEAIEPKLPK